MDYRGPPEELSGRIERRDVVGELSILTSATRSATVTATQDCGLLTLTAHSFDDLMTEYPTVVLAVTRIIARRLSSHSDTTPKRFASTTAIIPIHPGILLEEFVLPFSEEIGRTMSLRTIRKQEAQRSLSGRGGFSAGEAAFRSWLSRQEDSAESVILCGVSNDDHWNDLCFRHADRVVLLLDPQQAPDLTPFELTRLGRIDSTDTFRRDLVFCRRGDDALPRGRIAQFRLRRSHTGFHHVRGMAPNEIRRVARSINGSAVGVALGGGGARGLAHVGAAVALEMDHEEMRLSALRHLVADRRFRDPGVPLSALLRASKMSRGLRRYFEDMRIEELPVRYAAVATDLVARISRGPPAAASG